MARFFSLASLFSSSTYCSHNFWNECCNQTPFCLSLSLAKFSFGAAGCFFFFLLHFIVLYREFLLDKAIQYMLHSAHFYLCYIRYLTSAGSCIFHEKCEFDSCSLKKMALKSDLFCNKIKRKSHTVCPKLGNARSVRRMAQNLFSHLSKNHVIQMMAIPLMHLVNIVETFPLLSLNKIIHIQCSKKATKTKKKTKWIQKIIADKLLNFG